MTPIERNSESFISAKFIHQKEESELKGSVSSYESLESLSSSEQKKLSRRPEESSLKKKSSSLINLFDADQLHFKKKNEPLVSALKKRKACNGSFKNTNQNQ